jgi:hypothetical protein
MEQEQYQITAQGETFRPNKAVDYVREFDEAIEQSNSTREVYERSVRTRAEQEVQAAQKELKQLGDLSDLSQSLMDKLVDTQKKVNESQKAKGLADSLRNGIDDYGQLEVNEEEQLLAEGQQEVNKAADEYQVQGGSRQNRNVIRNQGGWYGYGKYIGDMTQLGENFSSTLLEAKNNGFSIEINGRSITGENAANDAEYQAWQNAVAQEYLKQAPDASDAVASKYLLKPIRKALGDDALIWSTANSERMEAEQKDNAIGGLYAKIKANDDTAINTFFTAYPGTKREARTALYEYLEVQVKSGAMSKEEALDLYDNSPISWNDGSQTTLAAQFPQDRAEFESDLEAKETAAIAQDAQADNAQVQSMVNDIKGLQRQLGRSLTDAELKEFEAKLPAGTDPKILNDAIYTVEEGQLDNARETLEDLYEAGELRPDMLDIYPPSIQKEFADKAELSGTYAKDLSGASKRVQDDAEAAARKALEYADGAVTTKSPKYLRAEREATRQFKQFYQKARRQGRDHEDALDWATDKLNALPETTLTAERASVPLPVKAEESRAFIRENGASQLIPDSTAELAQAVEYLKTGKGSMPGLYITLSENQYYTPRELVASQAQAAGMDIKDIALPDKNNGVQEFPPQIQELLKRYQSPARTLQAAVSVSPSTGDAKWVLDAIASKESGAAGYNAVNQIGLAGGHSTGAELGAFSGDFRKMSQHGGKPVTSMTIGEIMDLQDNTGANRRISDKQWIAAGRLHAVGRYQIVGDTMISLVKRLGLPRDTLFDEATQDRLALELVKRRAEAGNLTSGLRSEWIGLQYMNPQRYATLVEKAQRVVASPFNDPNVITPGVL